MADAGRVVLAAIDESTWGTTPSSALTKIAFATSENLGLNTSTTQSDAIRGDYTRPGVVRTDVQGTGGYNFELAYADGPMLSHLPGCLRSAWGSAVTTGATTLDAVNSTNKYTRAAGSFVTDGFAVGHSVIVSGFATAANNGIGVITAVDATSMTVAGLDLADESGGGDELIKHSGFVSHGTTLKSHTLERQFADLTNRFIAHAGMRVSEFSLSAQLGQIVKGSVAFMGKSPGALAAATAGSGAYSDSAGAANEIMNGIDHVTGIFLGSTGAPGVTATTFLIQQLDIRIGSPVRPIGALGNLGPQQIGGNSFSIGGTMRLYTDNNSIAEWDNYANFTEKSLWFRFQDTAGNAYCFYLPQVQYISSAGPNASGPDADVGQDIGFTCETEANSGFQIGITRLAA